MENPVRMERVITRKIYSNCMLFQSDLEQLIVFKIPCRISNKQENPELHDFFKKAYGACVYLRLPIETGKWEIRRKI